MKKVICKICKEVSEFRFHECKKGIQEYYGCSKCDNWCTVCRPSWNDELNSMSKSKENKKSTKCLLNAVRKHTVFLQNFYRHCNNRLPKLYQLFGGMLEESLECAWRSFFFT